MYWFFHRKYTFPVRSELNSICSVEYCSLHSGCTMAEAVRFRPVTAETRVRSRVSGCDKVKLGQFFSEYLGLPLSVHSTNAAYSPQSTRCPYQKEELANAGNFPKIRVTFEEFVSDTAPELGVPVRAAPRRAAPRRALCVSRSVPS